MSTIDITNAKGQIVGRLKYVHIYDLKDRCIGFISGSEVVNQQQNVVGRISCLHIHDAQNKVIGYVAGTKIFTIDNKVAGTCNMSTLIGGAALLLLLSK